MLFYSLKRNRFLLLPVLLWLAACATQLPVDEKLKQEQWQANREKVIQLDKWELKGRIAVSVKRQAWTASLQWAQERQDYQINIIAPLGQGSLELQGNRQGVTMRVARGKVLYAQAPETLMRKSLGWAAPVSGLRYWVRGLPVPGKRINKLSLDDNGRVTEMEQSGWQISYSRYSSRRGVELPGKVALQNGGIRLRLVIRDWLI